MNNTQIKQLRRALQILNTHRKWENVGKVLPNLAFGYGGEQGSKNFILNLQINKLISKHTKAVRRSEKKSLFGAWKAKVVPGF